MVEESDKALAGSGRAAVDARVSFVLGALLARLTRAANSVGVSIVLNALHVVSTNVLKQFDRVTVVASSI
jgi:hypothetical protein